VKTVAAKEAKNRFGQLLDDAQRGPVIIEKNGRPFAIVQSYADFEETQRLKLNALRQGIEAANVQLDAGQKMRFDQAAVDRIKAAGRAKLAERLANQ
jgi:prevent-host-death family protein